MARCLPNFSLAPLPVDAPDVPESGLTFAENARAKASAAARLGTPTLADDSGLCVDALGGSPGVFSARLAGDDEANRAELLRLLAGVPFYARGARFVCVVCLALPSGVCETVTGTVRGLILDVERGSGGFGYDSLFLYPPMGRSFAELPPAVKDRVSHRGRALALARPRMEALRPR